MKGRWLVTALICAVVAAKAGGASAGQLGNAATLRGLTDNTDNFTMLDLSPLLYNSVASPSYVTAWHWFTQDQTYWGRSVSPVQTMELMVWRPVAGTTYELVGKQIVTSGPNFGLHSAAAGPGIVVNPGDVLGYYVPTGQRSILSLDWPAGTAADPYWLSSGVVPLGTQHSFNVSNGQRTYSLYVDAVPIPEPVFFQFGAMMGLGGLGVFRLRRR